MVDIRDNIWDEEIEMCKQKKVNFSIFSKKFLSKYRKEIAEIQKEYFQIINVFLTGIPIHKMENISNYSEEKKDKIIRDTILCFRGIFREFLERITKRYSKKIWGIQRKYKKRNCKNFSEKKMCLG